LFNDGAVVTAAMLPRLDANLPNRLTVAAARFERPASDEPGTPVVRPLWQIEKEAIEEALARCHGNVPRAAALLEINPSTIYRRKAEWEKGRLAS
jgi:two-component system repressor protein LuxO